MVPSKCRKKYINKQEIDLHLKLKEIDSVTSELVLVDQDQAFAKVCSYLEANDEEQLTV
jgi:hypothetical protein